MFRISRKTIKIYLKDACGLSNHVKFLVPLPSRRCIMKNTPYYFKTLAMIYDDSFLNSGKHGVRS